MPDYLRLDSGHRGPVFELLSAEPETNLIMLHNISAFGMEPGAEPLGGHYFGGFVRGELVVAGAVYGVGSMFLYSREETSVEGLGRYLVYSGAIPRYLCGYPGPVSRVLDELESLLEVKAKKFPSQQMVLRTAPEGCHFRARRAAEGDLDFLLDMQSRLEKELYGTSDLDYRAVRRMLGWQVGEGFAFVAEADEGPVSKAEATVLKGTGGWLGGVYTLPGFRGMGYGLACVGALCAWILEEGEFATLVVDTNNYKAAGLYHKIGFRGEGDRMAARLWPRRSPRC